MSSRIFRDDLLQGKVAVVTGGGTGIGAATARELARLDHEVLICEIGGIDGVDAGHDLLSFPGYRRDRVQPQSARRKAIPSSCRRRSSCARNAAPCSSSHAC